jgi:hypothetical protein
MEKRSELKVVWAAMAIVGAQVLGVDVSALTSIIGTEGSEIISTIKAANSGGDGGMWAAVLAGVYAVGRSYLKGKIK